MNEQWRDVVGYEGRYSVSNLGEVKSLPNLRRRTEMLLKQASHVKSGHHLVNLTTATTAGWRQRVHYVHQLVLMAFVGPCPEGMEGCHNDGNTKNNALNNLRWGTRESNNDDRISHGVSNHGSRNGMAVLDESGAREVKRLLAEKKPQNQIALAMGISRTAVSAIATGRNWRDV